MSNVYELKPKDPDQTHARETAAQLLELEPAETCALPKCPHTTEVPAHDGRVLRNCPECGGVDGWLKTGRKDNWSYCREHHTIWWTNDFIGDGAIATPDEVARFRGFREVKSYTCPEMVAALNNVDETTWPCVNCGSRCTGVSCHVCGTAS
ncbi:MAG TPA: hypothetical protein VF024_05320 [Solirubrobacteraceae bacterium]